MKDFELIGITRSKNKIVIPYENNKDILCNFVMSFSLNDRIDILCISEYLSLKYKLSKFNAELRRKIETIMEFCLTFLENAEFQGRLDELKLPTSAARIILGEKLARP